MTNSDPDSTTNINRSGGADLNAQGDISIEGDVVGRDKITHTEQINTGGGTYVEGNVTAHEFVGRDKIIITGDQQYDVHGLANPYLGLQSFTYADHAKYAGREKLIAETVACLTAPDDPLALLFVTGASGNGKSSFVQAGVLPALEKHYAALNVKWAVFRPSRDPLAALADALWRQLGLPQFDTSADFGNFLKTHTPPQQVNVIVIDQFEELFTQSNAQPRDALFNLLTHLPPFRSARTHIIATVRADYLPELFALPTLYDIAKHGIDLRTMSVDELHEAIQQPLRATYPGKDKRFQSELVDPLAKDAAEDAAYLPLLQVTLEEIWRKGKLTLGAYTNLADAIKQRADKVLEFQDFDAAQPSQPRSPEEQAAILNLCLDLVDVSLDDEARRDVRRRRSKSELISGAPERARLIDTLAQARLLSVSTAYGKHSHAEVDLIHETLLSNWDRLQQAIAERRHELHQRVRFEQQLKEWIGQNRSDDYLLSGVHLAEARDLERRGDIALRSADAEDFVHRSVEREDTRRQKELDDARRLAEAERLRAEEQTRSVAKLRQRAAYLISALAVALFLGIAAGVFGVQSNQNADMASRNAATAQAASTLAVEQRNEAQKQAQIARSRQLANQSVTQLQNDNWEIAALLAIEAGRTAETTEAFAALRQALVHPGRTLFILPIPVKWGDFAVWNKDENRILTVCDDGTARVWDAQTGKELFILSSHRGGIYQAIWNIDGSRILTTGGDDTAQVWDAQTGTELLILSGHKAGINQAVWNKDESRILTVSYDDTARVWDAQTGKELLTLSHGEEIKQAVWNTDESRILTTGGDDTAQVWDAQTGKELFILSGHKGGIHQAAWNKDGSRILTASYDGTARVWDAQTGKDLFILSDLETRINQAVWNKDESLILTTSDDGTARVWDAQAGKELFTLSDHQGNVYQATWNKDGSRILTVSGDDAAQVWDAQTGKELFVLSDHEGNVYQATWNKDGSRILTVSRDDIARVWDAQTGKELLTLSHGEEIKQAVWNTDESCILTVGDAMVRGWDAQTGEKLFSLSGGKAGINRAVWNKDESLILTTSSDGTVRVWNIEKGTELPILSGHKGGIYQAIWNKDESRILTVGYDGTARVWDAQTGKEFFTISGGKVKQAVWNKDESRILTQSEDGTARVWDAQTGKELLSLTGHKVGINQAVWNKDESRILTAGCDRDERDWCVEGTARVWDAQTGEELLTLFSDSMKWVEQATWNKDESHILTLSADGQMIVVSGAARVWDAQTGKELYAFSVYNGTISSAVWNKDGTCILIASDNGMVRVWDAQMNKELLTLNHTSSVEQAMWNKDESRILTRSGDGTVQVWDTQTRKELLTLSQGGGVKQVVWNKDESRILTVGDDGTARVWDAQTGKELFSFPGNEAWWNADDSRLLTTAGGIWDAQTGQQLFSLPGNIVRWNADGSHILVEGQDAVHQYYTRINDLSKVACEHIPRNIFQEEWTQYLGDEPYRKTCDQWPLEPEATPTPTP